jgi:transposase
VVERFEVFTGAGKRREWPAEVKASIVAESFSGQASVSAIARRHGIAPNQLFAWRRDLRKEFEAHGVALPSAPPTPSFVPAVVDPLSAGGIAPASRRRRKRRRLNAGAVELEIDGVAVTIGRGADAEVIGAVIEALRGPR